MTALNMAKHRNNPNFAFWTMIKKGYDHFEATHREPKVAVCEKRYVFDAAAPENASQALSFNARGKCPAYELDKNIANAVLDKQRHEQFQMAEYIARGVDVVPARNGVDGGMNPVFASKLTIDNNGPSLSGRRQHDGARRVAAHAQSAGHDCCDAAGATDQPASGDGERADAAGGAAAEERRSPATAANLDRRTVRQPVYRVAGAIPAVRAGNRERAARHQYRNGRETKTRRSGAHRFRSGRAASQAARSRATRA